MSTDRYAPAPADRFSFGIWTVGWQGVDVFGTAVRPPMPAGPTGRADRPGGRAGRKLAEVGAYGVAQPNLAAGENWRDLRGFAPDTGALGARGMAFERLDQLALKHLYGVR